MTKFIASFLLLLTIQIFGIITGRRHGVEVLMRPDDVIGPDCGDDIKLTCMAKVKDISKEKTDTPDVEWWYRRFDVTTTSAEQLTQLEREGRISISKREFFVVQSILTIKDAKQGDEGVYQCRVSADSDRSKQGVNPLFYWQIEEAPVTGLQCNKALTYLSSTTTATLAKASTMSVKSSSSNVTGLLREAVPALSKKPPLNRKTIRKTKPVRGFTKQQEKRNIQSTTSHAGKSTSIHEIRFSFYLVVFAMDFIYLLS